MNFIRLFAFILVSTAAVCSSSQSENPRESHTASVRLATLPAKPQPLRMDVRKTAVIVIDMQNDFVSSGGLLDRIGLDVTGMQKIVEPIRKILQASRQASIPIVFLKMGYQPDLSDIGSEDSLMGVENRRTHVGEAMRTPDGRHGRYLVRDTWNTDIVSALQPLPGDTVLYKTRYSGFYRTKLDAVLKRLDARTLIMAGVTTSVCVESTVRDAMFHDYAPVVLSDCTAEPLGQKLARTSHEASLILKQAAPFGFVATSEDFTSAIRGYE